MRTSIPFTFFVLLAFLFTAACGEMAGEVEIEGTYDCTGERTESEGEAGEEEEGEPESMNDTITLSLQSETEVLVDSTYFGSLTGTLTAANTFSVSQSTSLPGLGLAGSADLEATGTVTGDTLTFTGTYTMPGLSVSFSLTGSRR